MLVMIHVKKQSSSGFVHISFCHEFHFHFVIGLGLIESKFGMLGVLRMVFGTDWMSLSLFPE